MDSSDKMENSVLGCRLSEKVEYLPIKKRRFLFETPSSPPIIASLEETESVDACLHSSVPEICPKPVATDPPASSLTDAYLHHSGSIDGIVDAEKFVKDSMKVGEDEDMRDTLFVDPTACCNDLSGDTDLHESSGIVSNDTKSLQATHNVELKAKIVKLETLSAMETDFDISTVPSKLDWSTADKASVDESVLDNSLSLVPSETECSKTQNSADQDDRLNWDLNTVMTAWEEPLECDRTINTADVACSKITYSEGKNTCGSVSENIGNASLPAELKTFTPKIEESELDACKPDSNGICKLLSPVLFNVPHVDSSTNGIPVSVPSTLTLEYATCDISAEHVNVDCKGTNVLSRSVAAVTDFSLDYNKPKDKVGSSKVSDYGNKVQTTENEKLTLSLVTTGSIDREVHQSGSAFDEDDKAKVKKVVTSNGVTMGNLIGKVTEISHNVVPSEIEGSGNYVNHAITTLHTTESEKLKLSLVTTTSLDNGVHQSESAFEKDDKSKVKRVIASNGITMENLSGKGTEISQDIVPFEIGGSGNYLNHTITTLQTTESEKLKLSLDTTTSFENGVHQSGSAFEEDDKSKVKRVIASNGITMENLSGKRTEISQDGHEGKCKEANRTNLSSVLTEGKDHPLSVSSMHEAVCSDAEVPIKSGNSPVTEKNNRRLSHESQAESPNDLVNNNKEVSDYENFPSDIQAGSEVDNVDEEFSYGYNSQFEDGEFRESSIQTWDEYDEDDKEIEHGTDLGAINAHKNSSLCAPESSQKVADEISSLLLPEKLDSSDQVSGSEPNETENGIKEVSMKDASQSDQWKMNITGSDILPENHSSSSNFTKIRDLRSIKFSSRIGRYGPQTDDLETKAEGSRFYRREPRDTFFDKGRFRMQGCSSSNADDSAFRSVRRGKYPSRIPVRGPFPGPSRLTDEPNVDPNISRQPFRTRLLANTEEDEFRARLGLRPSNDTCQNRFVNVGRGRSSRYGSRHNGGGPRGRYYGTATNDEFDESSMEYSHSFPVRRRCFSPTHHRGGSTSPRRSQNRSPIHDSFRNRCRSPILRSDTRIRRVNLEPRTNNSSPTSRWVNYKQRSPPPPPPPIKSRVGFFESSRKTKQNENYGSVPGRFSDVRGHGRGGPRFDDDVSDHGDRLGGFVRRYDTGQPVKIIQYDDADGYNPVYESRDKEGLEFHGRGNPKPYSNGTDSRFRDIPRRPRDDRENC